MKNKRKRFKKAVCTYMVAMLTMISSTSHLVSAEAGKKTKESEFNTLEKLEDVIKEVSKDDVITNDEKKYIVENTEDEITAEYSTKFMGLKTIKLCLSLDYTISGYKITAKKASTRGTTAIGSVTSSAKITDKTADKHSHDMNAVGSYNYNAFGYLSTEVELELFVKWDRDDKYSSLKYITYQLKLN